MNKENTNNKESDKPSMTISSASITVKGKKHTIIKKPVRLSVDESENDSKSSGGSAMISAPINDLSNVKANTTGGGRVASPGNKKAVQAVVEGKRIVIKNATHYAVLKIKHKHDEGTDYFDVVVGKKLQERDRTEPHVTFRFDGSGQFLREGTINTEAVYDKESGVAVPTKVKIYYDKDSNAKVEIILEADKDWRKVTAKQFKFVD